MRTADGRRFAPGAEAAAQPWDALMIAAAAYLLVGAARLHTLIPGAHLLRPGLLFAAIGMFAYLQDSHPARSIQRLRHPLALCMAFVVIWATLGAPFGLYPGKSVRFLATNFYTTVLLFVLVAAAVRDVADLRRMLGAYAAGAVVFSLFAALPGGYRAIGAGGYDANDSAMFVVSAVPLAAYFAATARGGLARIAWAAGIVVCTIAVVRSGSRGAFLAFGAVVIYQLIMFRALRPAWRFAGAAALVGCLLIVAAREPEYWERMSTLRNLDEDYNTTELAGRRQIWTRGVGYALQNPIFGVGINNFSVAEGLHPTIVRLLSQGVGVKFSAAHSVWVEVGAELGLLAFGAYVGAFLVAGAGVIRLRRRARARGDPVSLELSGMADAMGAVIVGAAVAGTFLSQAYGSILWGVLGLALAVFKIAALSENWTASSVAYTAAATSGRWYRPSVLYDPRAPAARARTIVVP